MVHVAINDDQYAIFVWDTRKVLETKKLPVKYDVVNGLSARDNHEPLDGVDAKAFDFSKAINPEVQELLDEYKALTRTRCLRTVYDPRGTWREGKSKQDIDQMKADARRCHTIGIQIQRISGKHITNFVKSWPWSD